MLVLHPNMVMYSAGALTMLVGVFVCRGISVGVADGMFVLVGRKVGVAVGDEPMMTGVGL